MRRISASHLAIGAFPQQSLIFRLARTGALYEVTERATRPLVKERVCQWLGQSCPNFGWIPGGLTSRRSTRLSSVPERKMLDQLTRFGRCPDRQLQEQQQQPPGLARTQGSFLIFFCFIYSSSSPSTLCSPVTFGSPASFTLFENLQIPIRWSLASFRE